MARSVTAGDFDELKHSIVASMGYDRTSELVIDIIREWYYDLPIITTGGSK